MYEIHVSERFTGSLEAVFERISDHEEFVRGGRVERCTIITPGHDERDGLGARREVVASPLRFVERIVRFDRPRRYDYRVERLSLGPLRLPFEHELGWLELREDEGEVIVDWRSRFRVPVPLLGAMLEPAMGRAAGRMFAALLRRASRA